MNPTNDYQNLLFQTSPFGHLDAIVESDGRAVYFYLANDRNDSATPFPTRACWVRNLARGPIVINKREMEQGLPPLLPRTHARFSDPQPLPNPESLNVVWFEEGNGAALCEDKKVLAVIPPWSGMEGFHGYAADCVAESPVCWPMPAGASDPLFRRINAAREFWKSFEPDSGSDYFKLLQTELLNTFATRFGPHEAYFAIDGENFPPKGLARFRDQKNITLLTVALSLCPQPNVELFAERPSDLRRIELGIRLPGGTDDSELDTVQQSLSRIASYPWRNLAWIGHGDTINWLPGRTLGEYPADFALVVSDSVWQTRGSENDAGPSPAPEFNMPQFRDDPVSLLWLLPISASERQQLSSKSLTLEQLLDRYPFPR